MEGPSRTINPSCVPVAELKQGRGLKKRPVEFKPYYKTLLSENLGTHAVNGQLEKPMQKYKCLSKPTANHVTS